MVRLRKSNKRL
nr:unnamed protein product [Callosobruchus chinensis]